MERQPQSVSEVVAATLREMDLVTDEAALDRTILIRDGNFVGHKFRFDGGFALWLPEKGGVEVYTDSGTLLKTISSETGEKKAA